MDQNDKRPSWKQTAFLLCVTLVTAILLTYTLTAAAWRRAYTEKLREQQEQINAMNDSSLAASENLQILDSLLETYSYYAETMDKEAMMEAAFKAYVEASGDLYAQYYTEEEYEAIDQSNQAVLNGIGVGVIRRTFEINGDGQARAGFYIYEIYEGSSAKERDLQIGDIVCGVEVDGVMKTVSELGYSAASSAIRGEESTTVKVKVFRADSQGDRLFDVELVRRCFEIKSVSGRILESNPSVGVVRISSFDLKTPSQLKQVMADLMAKNVAYFVFDLRNNPGGDLQSIRAVMSYFLQKGDLILDVIDREGAIVRSYKADVITDQGDCNVAEQEIGMYRNLKMAVLCNENTASAAEVFTATMQDYGLAQIVGVNTFGKGIMQSTKKISFGDAVGYVKFTTYAYQTKRGESYHGEGITPDCVVDLSEEAKKQPILLLEQDQDEQLKIAAQLLLADHQ